ncbi:hypothetical protein GCM10025781_13610 [Kocuria gwangalliensis]|uniref:Uncharacterized protein n=1 Tax=Kocuria gwangalliensis TaxID=501592 RepID=A0ABP8X0R4_9MICC
MRKPPRRLPPRTQSKYFPRAAGLLGGEAKYVNAAVGTHGCLPPYFRERGFRERTVKTTHSVSRQMSAAQGCCTEPKEA